MRTTTAALGLVCLGFLGLTAPVTEQAPSLHDRHPAESVRAESSAAIDVAAEPPFAAGPARDCPDATISVEILTNDDPGDTTWEVVDRETATVVASGGPYEEVGTLYIHEVCVDSTACYDFTIYDGFGDGLCCRWGAGHYQVYYEGVLVGSGGEFGTSETVGYIGGGCGTPIGACCDDDAGLCTDDVELPDCTPPLRFTPDALCADLEPPCGAVHGACCFGEGSCQEMTEADCVDGYGAYQGDGTTCLAGPCTGACCFDDASCRITTEEDCGAEGRTYLGAGTTCDMCPCVVPCQPEAVPEGEPTCGDDYVDTYNGGCDSAPPVFQPIAFDEPVCGESGTYLLAGDPVRESDWFQVTLPEDGNIIWEVEAEFDTLIMVLAPGPETPCDNYLVLASASAVACERATALTECLAAGTYWLWVGPAETEGVPCGATYEAGVTWEPGFIPIGACCHPLDGCIEDASPDDCTAGGGVYAGNDVPCDEMECPEFAENDLCADALRMAVPGVTFGTTSGATVDSELPECGTSITAPGVWYSVIGTGNTMTATTCTSFVDFYDTKLSVYCAGCEEPVCIGGNDDECAGGVSDVLSTVTWCSIADVEYLILVHGHESESGGFLLEVSDDGVPCPDAIPCGPAAVASTDSRTLFRGDTNCDGLANTFDIDPFVLALTEGQSAWEAEHGCDFLGACDVNCDGAVNAADIDPFVGVLVDGQLYGCGACCYGDGTCADQTDSDCADQGGEYQGNGTSCGNTKPKITAQPADAVVGGGGNATFTVTATGGGQLHYKWKKNNVVVGTDSNTLTLTNVGSSDDKATVTCEVSDTCGTTQSRAAKLEVLTLQSRTDAKKPLPRTRTTLGIGEKVLVYTEPSKKCAWSVTGGGTVVPGPGTATQFRASMSPSTSTVKATYKGVTRTIVLTVVAPEGMQYAADVGDADGWPATPGTNRIGNGREFPITLLPTTVSFGHLRWRLRENIPGNDITWPDGHVDRRLGRARVDFDVTVENKNIDQISTESNPITRLRTAAGVWRDFTATVGVPLEYRNQAGRWTAFMTGVQNRHDSVYEGTNAPVDAPPRGACAIRAVGTGDAQTSAYRGPWD